jgi:hypothetical protein
MPSVGEIVSSAAIWVGMVAVPLILTTNDNYKLIFPSTWYDEGPLQLESSNGWPNALGLCLGLFAVVVGQIGVLIYFVNWKAGRFGGILHAIQKGGAPLYDVWEGVRVHLSQPEGFVLLGGYLSLTWMMGIMPASYYSFSGGINWWHVVLQLLIQDVIQTLMHLAEHEISKDVYRFTHKPHHRFTNPKLFDAFNGSLGDTFFMILVPLMVTARLVHANVWSYMAFGSIYANWLTLIHSEYSHPWDGLFRALRFGTASDHHVHHKLFIFNFGHLFM